MITLPTFMKGVDFFETTLQEDLDITGVQILLSAEALERIPSTFPFPLVLGDEGNEELVLVTGPGYSGGLQNGKLQIDRTVFGSTPVRGHGRDSRVMCAPSYEFFREIQDVLSESYRKLEGTTKFFLFIFGANYESNGVLEGMETTIDGESLCTLHVSAGIGVAEEGNFVTLFSDESLNILAQCRQVPISPPGYSSAGLLGIDKFENLVLTVSEPSTSTPVVPECPEGIVKLASFVFNATGVVGEITDERVGLNGGF